MKSRQTGSAHLVIIIVLVVVVLGLLGFVFWQHFLQPKTITTASTTTSKTTSKSSGLSAADTIKALSAEITTKDGTATSKVTVNLNTQSAPAYKVSGDDYYTSATTGANFSITDPSSTNTESFGDAVSVDIDTYFTNNGFSKSTTNTDTGIFYYQTSSVVCSTVTGEDPEGASCGNTSDYTTASTAIAPFAAAYKLGSQYATADTVYTTPTIKDSHTSGYKTAELEIYSYQSPTGGFAGLFYQKNGGTWIYFTGAQQELTCDQYNTADLKAAYAGTACFDGSSDSTVQ